MAKKYTGEERAEALKLAKEIGSSPARRAWITINHTLV